MKNINSLHFLKGKTNKNLLFTCLALLPSFSLLAQDTVVKEDGALSVFANPLFDVLFIIIILLLIVISALGGALKNVAKATKSNTNKKDISGKIIGMLILVLVFSSTKTIFAQGEIAQSAHISGFMGLNSTIFYLLLLFIGFELAIIFSLTCSIKLLLKKDEEEIYIQKEEPSLLERFNASVAIEKEGDIMLDHNYDGIRELDNDLPPWWKYGFYASIVFAFVYLIHYHVTATGDLQIAEYNKSIQAAEISKAEFEKNNAENVTESTVTMLTDKEEIAKGEKTFKETCFACHGKFGEGGVGPNLTDDYWINGGTIKDIFSTIKYGKPDKGMKSWQADLSAIQIQELASYIKTIHGTNPPNGKAPQGDLYTELKIMKDSLKIENKDGELTKSDSIKMVEK